jgi:indolepyruvate ferredoxin oxidoreductase alpha subunit
MKKMLLLGDEALGQGAIDAGITTAYAYPGTPSTEIFEYVERIAKKKGAFKATWAANEKVAYEESMGTSFCGRRSLVVMKHVGLNVAADPFMNSASTGAQGGLVLAVADDPSMHSSQNEQDSRVYADFAQVHCYEPATQQEAYDMTREAYETSERFEEPVMLRLVTRLAHSRADVEVQPPREQNALAPSDDKARWTLLPTNARPQYKKLVEKQPGLKAFCEESRWNQLVLNPSNRKLGVITSGVAYNYFREVAGENPPSYLKIGLYPIPVGMVLKLLDHVEQVLFVEEGYPFIEKSVVGLIGMAQAKGRFLGRNTGHVPPFGELTPDVVAHALGVPGAPHAEKTTRDVRPRPPQLCPGCPHADTFHAINDVKAEHQRAIVFSDIGCYTLGFYAPFETIESCLDMGASISMAKGAADAGAFPVMCVIGDSTFGHSGITPLLTAAQENTNMVVFVVDNGTVAMTGTQDSLSTGTRLLEIIRGVGVHPDHVRVINPLPKNRAENARIIREEVAYPGLSVIVPTRACVQLKGV